MNVPQELNVDVGGERLASCEVLWITETVPRAAIGIDDDFRVETGVGGNRLEDRVPRLTVASWVLVEGDDEVCGYRRGDENQRYQELHLGWDCAKVCRGSVIDESVG